MSLNLSVLVGELAVVRLPPAAPFPGWLCEALGKNDANAPIVSLTKTSDELSVVMPAAWLDRFSSECESKDAKTEREWRAFKVEGPLDFSLVGIMAKLSALLAEKKISVFVLSTYDTDYILVKQDKVEAAADALEAGGHAVAR
jgi:hypothetical protein